MNDLSYISLLSDIAILKEVGKFVKAKRIELNLTQNEIAKRAAISRSTLSLLERGENIALTNLLKILRVLDALYVFEQFRVVEQVSPIQLAREEENKRKRASWVNKQSNKNNSEW